MSKFSSDLKHVQTVIWLLHKCQITKNFGQKFWPKNLYKNLPKNCLRRMCGVLKTDFLKVYRSVTGITGHPSKNLVIGCSWMQKSVCEYLVPFSNGRCKTGGPTWWGPPKKKVTLFQIKRVISVFTTHRTNIKIEINT